MKISSFLKSSAMIIAAVSAGAIAVIEAPNRIVDEFNKFFGGAPKINITSDFYRSGTASPSKTKVKSDKKGWSTFEYLSSIRIANKNNEAVIIDGITRRFNQMPYPNNLWFGPVMAVPNIDGYKVSLDSKEAKKCSDDLIAKRFPLRLDPGESIWLCRLEYYNFHLSPKRGEGHKSTIVSVDNRRSLVIMMAEYFTTARAQLKRMMVEKEGREAVVKFNRTKPPKGIPCGPVISQFEITYNDGSKFLAPIEWNTFFLFEGCSMNMREVARGMVESLQGVNQ